MFDPQKRQLPTSSVAQLVARSAVMTAKSMQPEGFWFDPRRRRMMANHFLPSLEESCLGGLLNWSMWSQRAAFPFEFAQRMRSCCGFWSHV